MLFVPKGCMEKVLNHVRHLQTFFERKNHLVKIGSFEMEFQSIHITLREHLQALSVAANLFCFLCGIAVCPLILLVVYFYSRFWFLVPLYMCWIYYDRDTGFIGGRRSQWFRKSIIFKYYRDYFPCRLVKTVDLPPTNNYLFVIYPHGVLPFSTLANFATEANHVEDVFPGLEIRICTLDINFYFPLTREYFLSLGAVGAKESSILNALSKKPVKAVALFAGGASEAALAHPGKTYRIITTRRKGFVRIALKTGSPLVPVFSFGENNTYGQYSSKLIVFLQQVFKNMTGILPVVPRGRGFFQLNFGILPNKTEITTVVGKPIPVPKVENPSNELINEYHKKFMHELQDLFEKNKEKYDPAKSDAELVML